MNVIRLYGFSLNQVFSLSQVLGTKLGYGGLLSIGRKLYDFHDLPKPSQGSFHYLVSFEG